MNEALESSAYDGMPDDDWDALLEAASTTARKAKRAAYVPMSKANRRRMRRMARADAKALRTARTAEAG